MSDGFSPVGVSQNAKPPSSGMSKEQLVAVIASHQKELDGLSVTIGNMSKEIEQARVANNLQAVSQLQSKCAPFINRQGFLVGRINLYNVELKKLG